MTEQEMIEEAIIGKRIVAVSWLPIPSDNDAFELSSITLEGGITLSLWIDGFPGTIAAEIEESEHAD